MSDHGKKDFETRLESNEEKLQSILSIEEMAMEQIRLASEQVKLAREQIREARRGWLITLIFGFLGLIATIIAIYFSYLGISNKVGVLSGRVASVETNVLAERFVIISPSDGASVQLTDMVRVKTPFAQMNHYLVITPLKTGDDWVQDNPTKADSAGTWVGSAKFGTGDAGADERFLVRVLATKSTIPPGQLKALPPDGVYSESITVTRQK